MTLEVDEVDVSDAGRSRAATSTVGLRLGQFVAVPATVLALWWLLAVVVGPVAVASPPETARAMVDGLRDGWLTEPLLHTLRATALGFLLAAAAGLWLGFTLGMSRFWGDVFEAPLIWLYSIPKVTLFPLFLLFLGLGTSSEVMFGAFHGVFPQALFLIASIRGISGVLLRVARLYRLSRWDTFRSIVLPDTLPATVMGLRYCFSLTFLGVILAEMFAARAGAGYELMQAISLNNMSRIFAIAIALVIVALVVNALLLVLQGVVNRRRGGVLDAVTPT